MPHPGLWFRSFGLNYGFERADDVCRGLTTQKGFTEGSGFLRCSYKMRTTPILVTAWIDFETRRKHHGKSYSYYGWTATAAKMTTPRTPFLLLLALLTHARGWDCTAQCSD